MIVFDIAVALLVVALLIRGAWTGFVRQVAVIAALILGLVIAGRFYGESARFVLPATSPQIGFIVSYVVLFLAAYLAVIGLGFGLRKVMTIALLGWFDRLLGGLFGLIKAGFLASLLYLLVAGLLSDSKQYLERSLFQPILATSSHFILTFVQDPEVRARFLPKEPAIPSILLLSPASEQPESSPEPERQ